jgi:hypothetical protein
MQSLRRVAGNAAGPASVLAAVVSFVTDVLQPLGNYAIWVAGISLLIAILSTLAFIRLRRKPGVDALENPLLGVMVVSIAFTLFFGAWSLIEANGPSRGYLAANVDPIAQVQAQLLGLQKDVGEIKQTTQQSATVVASAATVQSSAATAQAQQGQDAAKAATAVAAAATAQAQGFGQLQAAFATLSSKGSLSPDPQTPQEWYANARLYQFKGDTANAIKAYEGYLAFKLDYVDPYDEYIALLKATEGIARTRQIVGDMQRASPASLALELALTNLLDAAQDRLPRLTALTVRAPQFAPGFLALAQEYDRALVGSTVTGDLLRKQQDAYAALFKLEEQQGLTRFYIDKALAEKTLTEAHKMQAAYANAGKVIGTSDVQIYRYYNGVQFIIVLTDFNVRQVLFSIDDPQPKTDTGKNTAGGQTFVNMNVGPIPLALGDHTFYMQYVDANGTLSKVFSKTVHVDPIAVNFQQQPPDFSTNTVPGIFSIGVVGTQGFEPYTFSYSLDSDALDKSLPGVAVGALPVTGLKRGDHVLAIRATAADGKQTPIVKFVFTVN